MTAGIKAASRLGHSRRAMRQGQTVSELVRNGPLDSTARHESVRGRPIDFIGMSYRPAGRMAGDASLPAVDARQLRDMRLDGAAQLRRWRVRDELVEDAGLVIGELVANAFLHGAEPGRDVVLTLSLHESAIGVTVADGCPALPRLPHAAAADPAAYENGRGLLHRPPGGHHTRRTPAARAALPARRTPRARLRPRQPPQAPRPPHDHRPRGRRLPLPGRRRPWRRGHLHRPRRPRRSLVRLRPLRPVRQDRGLHQPGHSAGRSDRTGQVRARKIVRAALRGLRLPGLRPVRPQGRVDARGPGAGRHVRGPSAPAYPAASTPWTPRRGPRASPRPTGTARSASAVCCCSAPWPAPS